MRKILFLFVSLFFILPSLVFAEQIDINSATLSQLDELTGIGPKYAQAIIDARPFSSVDDLIRVKGIGEKTLQKIKDQGLACVSCAQETQANFETQILNSETNSNTVSVAEPTVTAVAPVVYPDGVFISELLPSPKGADETDEWIELQNTNNFDVDLSGWQIKDSVGTIKIFTIPDGTALAAGEYTTFARPMSKIMLNNDNDGLTLQSPDGAVKDDVSYTKALTAQSYNKTANGWQWSTSPTPGTKNIITASKTVSALPKTENSVKNNNVEQGIAGLAQSLNTNQDYNKKTSNPWFLFFTVLAVTIILASLVLFIKLKFQSNVRT